MWNEGALDFITNAPIGGWDWQFRYASCNDWAGIAFKLDSERPMKMATRGSAKCTGRSEQKCQASSAGILKTSYNPPLHPLTLEEVRCPVCSEILLEPVTMPCSHSVCLHCFKRTVECSSQCCPLCRLRVSSWARKQSNSEKGLVNTELWDVVRKSYPERCKSRMEQRDCDSIKGLFVFIVFLCLFTNKSRL